MKLRLCTCQWLIFAVFLAPPFLMAEPNFKILPSPMTRGTVARVLATDLPPQSQLKGTFEGRPVFFSRIRDQEVGLLAADLLLSPGRYPLKLSWNGGTMELEVTVRDRSDGVRSITVPKSQVNLTRADQDRAARERKEVLAALTTQSPTRLWEGSAWQDVVPGAVSSAFGRQTRINGVLSPRPHTGTDFVAPEGTPVRAPAGGVVILVADHFFAGKSVYIDHGHGLISMYFHLSKFEVHKGQKVKAGQVIALTGSTGRVDGAHLHYGIYLNQARIDPVDFHRLTALLPAP